MKRLAAAMSIVALLGLGAVAAYRWTARSTPVSLAEAVEQFREIKEETGATAPSDRVASDAPSKEVIKGRGRGGFQGKRPDNPASPEKGREAVSRKVSAGAAQGASPQRSDVMAMPLEGVYTYDTSGYESILSWRRDFPEQSRRLVTYDDADTWTEHHLFSQEREVWSNLTMTSLNRLVHYQRNYIKIGPYEKDEKVGFGPPAISAVFPLRLDQSWSGEFAGESESGKYFGTYRARVVDRGVMTVGATRTQVWGVEMLLEFRGDLQGTVELTRWVSTEFGVNVQETYAADMQVGPLPYHGEWTMRLTSLVPRR